MEGIGSTDGGRYTNPIVTWPVREASPSGMAIAGLRTVQIAPDGALWPTTSKTDGRGDVRDGDDRILRFPA